MVDCATVYANAGLHLHSRLLQLTQTPSPHPLLGYVGSLSNFSVMWRYPEPLSGAAAWGSRKGLPTYTFACKNGRKNYNLPPWKWQVTLELKFFLKLKSLSRELHPLAVFANFWLHKSIRVWKYNNITATEKLRYRFLSFFSISFRSPAFFLLSTT